MPTVSLREYVESRLTSLENATLLAKDAMERRLEGMNEFREALRDQSSKFVSSAEFDALRCEVQELKEFRAEMRGKASMRSVILAGALALTGALLGLINLVVALTR